MSRFFSLTLVAALAACLSLGCTNSAPPETATNSEASAGDDVAGKLCGDCGDEKGSSDCCSESAAKCDGCGMNEGSKLCCVELDASVAGKDMCGSCGHAAGSESCCVEGAEKCECGMAKGSPLCCKLKDEAHEGHDHDHDHAEGEGH